MAVQVVVKSETKPKPKLKPEPKAKEEMELWIQIQIKMRELKTAALLKLEQDQAREASALCLKWVEAERDRLLEINPGDELRIEAQSGYCIRDVLGVCRPVTYRLMRGRKCLFSCRSRLPRRNGDTEINTADSLEFVLDRISKDTSTRSTAAIVNSINPASPIDHTTLRRTCESIGLQIDTDISAAVADVGEIPTRSGAELERKTLDPKLIEETIASEVPKHLQDAARANPVPFTAASATVDLSVDTVFVKKQTEFRQAARKKEDEASPLPAAPAAPADRPKLSRKERKALKEVNEERKTVSVVCGRLILNHQHLITLVATSYGELYARILAVLVAGEWIGLNFCLFGDGEKVIRETALRDVSGKVRGFFQVLDWYHLEKKASDFLKLAIPPNLMVWSDKAQKDVKLRDVYRAQLVALLWHGATDAAIAFLKGLDPAHLRTPSPKSITDLIGYLEARKDQIPVYSVRKKLGLRVSSNGAEKTCDLCVSARQKGRGMAWSQDGSYALAIIRAASISVRLRTWLDSGRFELIPSAEAG